MKKQPEKTAQTKQSMIESFWGIAKNRGLSDVTISEVTKKAGLNRGTFYVYFTDLDDLLYQAEEEIISDLRISDYHNDCEYPHHGHSITDRKSDGNHWAV